MASGLCRVQVSLQGSWLNGLRGLGLRPFNLHYEAL